MNSRLPLQIADVFPRLGLQAQPLPPASFLGKIEPEGAILEDFLPITQSLEWRLARHYWTTQGLLPFVDGEVPFWINNTGRLSEDAAVLLFAFCEEMPAGETVRVVEFGAGIGLFARYFLDDFRSICQDEGRDFYSRLHYLVTDLSPMTVQQWRERNLFDGHEQQVELLSAPADEVPILGAHAVFANYVLDVLSATIVEPASNGNWQEVRVRTRWRGDTASLKRLSGWTPEEARTAAAGDSELPRFERLMSQLDLEVKPFPFEGSPLQREMLGHAGSGRQALNYGAAGLIRQTLADLDPRGFMLINDYGPTKTEEAGQLAFSQRFGRTSAIPLNFPLLGAYVKSLGFEVLIPEEDETLPIHARLLGRNPPRRLLDFFQNRFSRAARTRLDTMVNEARAHIAAGRNDDALKAYTQVLGQAPRDWSLLGEIADFVGVNMNDPASGLELARGAVQRNPWYSCWLWNILGDCLYGLRRFDEAHEAYLQAERIDPSDPRTNLNLSFALAQSGNYDGALLALARGLASERSLPYRERLLARQAEVLQAVSAEAAREFERQQRRVARLSGT